MATILKMARTVYYTFYFSWGDPQNPRYLAPLIDCRGNIDTECEGSSEKEARDKIKNELQPRGNVRLITIEDPFNDTEFHKIISRGDEKSIAKFKVLGILKNDPPPGEPVWRETRLSID